VIAEIRKNQRREPILKQTLKFRFCPSMDSVEIGVKDLIATRNLVLGAKRGVRNLVRCREPRQPLYWKPYITTTEDGQTRVDSFRIAPHTGLRPQQSTPQGDFASKPTLGGRLIYVMCYRKLPGPLA
jgi:hypothetical protein